MFHVARTTGTVKVLSEGLKRSLLLQGVLHFSKLTLLDLDKLYTVNEWKFALFVWEAFCWRV